MRRFIRTSWKVSLVLALTLVLWGAWYVNTQGFSKKWRNYINSEFREHGFEVAIERLTLDPFRGLVAQNVLIYPYEDAARPTGEISEIALDVDYSRLMQGKDFLNAIDLRHSDVKIPLVEDEPPLIIQDLTARISLPPNEIILRELEAHVLGVRVTADGRLETEAPVELESLDAPRKTSAEKPTPPRGEARDPGNPAVARWWPVIRKELLRFKAQTKPAQLKLSFQGHLDHPDQLQVNAQFTGRDLLREEERFDLLKVEAHYANRELTLKNIEVESSQGSLKANAAAGRGHEGGGRFQLAGKFNFLPFLKPFLPENSVLRDVELQTPPQLAVTGSLRQVDGKANLELVGRLGSENPVFRGETFEHLEADFALNGGRWMIQGLQLSHASGKLTGAMRVLPDDVRAELESTLSPRAISAVLGRSMENLLKDIELPRSPVFKLRSAGKAMGRDSLDTQGTISLPRFRYRGVWFESGSARVANRGGVTTLDDIVLKREEGSIRGKAVITRDANLLMENIVSTISAPDLTKVLGPTLERYLQSYRLRGNPTVTAGGRMYLHPGGSSDLKIFIDSPEGMDATLFGKVLPVDMVASEVTYRDGILRLNGLRGRVFDGDVKLELEAGVRGGGRIHFGEVTGTDINYGKLVLLYARSDKLDGVMSGKLNFRSATMNLRSLEGEGQFEVISQNVFSMPILGTLSSLLDNTIGFGAGKARSLNVDFDIVEGRVKADPVQILSSGYSLQGAGTYDLVDRQLDANMRVNMRGGPGILLYPVSKLLEFTASGTLQDPNWRPKNFSRAPREADEDIPVAIPVDGSRATPPANSTITAPQR